MTTTLRSTTSRARARLLAAAAFGAFAFLVSPHAHAQTAVTLLARPQDATIALRGPSDIVGGSPLELGPEWTGKFTVVVQAPGHAAAEGTLYLPGPGGVPRLLSDPSGLSGGLILKSLYFPGAAALLGHRQYRGLVLLSAGLGGVGAVVRDQIEYSSKKDDPGFEGDRALDFKYARDRWVLYTGGVWLLSAVDNIVRPRLDEMEASTTKITLRTPEISRSGLIWRSILVPGAGQDCAGKNIRGAAWLGATLLAGAAYVTASESHHRIQTKLAEANELLLTATPGELADRQADVDHFTEREDDSKKLMDKLALTTLVIYVANVVDAGLVNFGESQGLAKVSLAPTIGIHRTAISVRLRY
jgi:hypothetical protein